MTRRIEDYPKASRCGNRLHDWRQVAGGAKTFREDCMRCGTHNIWPVGVGGFSRDWAEAHARDALQPYGPDKSMFIQEYGMGAYERAMAKRKPDSSWQDVVDEGKDGLKMSKRSIFT